MRLRRIEIIVIAVTLAFVFFIGGFFTGRSWSIVNVISAPAQSINQPTIATAGDKQEVQVSTNRETQENQQTTEHITEKINQVPAPSSETQEDTIGLPRNSDGKININLASLSELTDLPGIGNVLASRIVDYRKANGNFARIEDIKNVSGIGEKRYETIEDKITVG